MTVIGALCDAAIRWLAPILVFTADEAWRQFRPHAEPSVHLTMFPDIPAVWLDEDLAKRWAVIRQVRRVVTGALEIARTEKKIGSSLEAAPHVVLSDAKYSAALEASGMLANDGAEFADVCITSAIEIDATGNAGGNAFSLPDAPGIAVEVRRAAGIKCARSWKYFDEAAQGADYPGVTPRDAQALRELKAAGLLA